MGMYSENGVCLGKDYKNSNYYYSFGNIDSVIEDHEWTQGFVLYREVKRVLDQTLKNVGETKERIDNGEDIVSKERYQKEYTQLTKLIQRLNENNTEDEWYFFELFISSYDGLNVDKVEYLPIKF